MKLAATVLALGVLTAGIAGITVRADDPLLSHWRTDEVRIDGVMSDWPQQTFVSKEVSTSVVNDSQDLYVLVATSDRAVNLQLTRAGLAVYLDPKGGKGHGFGIRIPPLGDRLSAGNAPVGGEGQAPALSYFDVLGPGADEMRRVDLAEGTGVDLRIGTHDGMFFLELKVPFVTGTGRPYAPGINLAKGEVGLGIVTPAPRRDARSVSGGRGGFMGGRGGNGGMPEPPKGKALNIWKKVVLAKAR